MNRNATIASLTLSDLRSEMKRRERGVTTLVRRRERLLERVANIDTKIRKHGGSIRGGLVRKRPKNAMNLVESLRKVLDGKTMSVMQVTEKVQKAGYKTTSPSFYTIVNQTLIYSGKFKRIQRGQYTAK